MLNRNNIANNLLRGLVAFILGQWLQVAGLRADVVKPALIEITADVSGTVSVEIRVSLEALLTGINARYKNTRQAPTAVQYDELRVLSGRDLQIKFKAFEETFLNTVFLSVDRRRRALQISSVSIPDPGYTKVPRISTIVLTAPLQRSANSLQFYYPTRFGECAIRVRQVDKAAGKYHWSDWQWVRTDEPSNVFSLQDLFAKPPITQVIWSYILIGFMHILPKGVDHIAFIVGLFLFSPKLRPLFWQVTMFTLAHTLTLGLSMVGFLSLPSRIVEPLIAASIAYVGIENIRSRRLGSSRLALVFGFGLLHGLGFASVLAEFGLSSGAFMTSLISFNVGVELGQLAILLTCYGFVGYWFGEKSWYRKGIIIPASTLISLVALYWMLERLDWIT